MSVKAAAIPSAPAFKNPDLILIGGGNPLSKNNKIVPDSAAAATWSDCSSSSSSTSSPHHHTISSSSSSGSPEVATTAIGSPILTTTNIAKPGLRPFRFNSSGAGLSLSKKPQLCKNGVILSNLEELLTEVKLKVVLLS